jgi:hypothetical protein
MGKDEETTEGGIGNSEGGRESPEIRGRPRACMGLRPGGRAAREAKNEQIMDVFVFCVLSHFVFFYNFLEKFPTRLFSSSC